MESVFIFVPNSILKEDFSGYLLGFLKEDSQICRKFIYITTLHSKLTNSNIIDPHEVLGTFVTQRGESLSPLGLKQNVSLKIQCRNREVTLVAYFLKGQSQPLNNCIVIIYDTEALIKSELFLCLDFDESREPDHFKILANNLKKQNERKHEKLGLSDYFVKFCLTIFSFIHSILTKGSFIPRYSSLGAHIKKISFSIICNCQMYKKHQYINLKIGNYLMSTICDIFIGLFVYYLFNSWKSAEEMFISLSSSTENVIDSISELVKLLMGSPAGLKLNQPLNNLLGSLVLYYLEIWWAFLSFARPALEFAFFILLKIGFLGFTFQLAVCADILAIISFHVYCIYIYAARLYEIQAKGLYSLSRLVLGRKRNPEPGKIDSCPYSTEELLIGTISFAVLLFLLPTTLVYYVVFTAMRLGVKTFSGIINWTMYFIQTLPVYSTIMWLFFPSYTASTMELTPLIGLSKAEYGSLIAEPMNSPWLETVKQCIPDSLSPPNAVAVGQTMWKVITGNLI